jgi:transcriptional regulator with XRE-family HTH domain
MNKDIHPVDRLVGQRVRLIRISLGMSQTTLASRLGLTFQQVQKYEKGTNRISASKLYEIAKVLKVDLASLFQDVTSADDYRGSTVAGGNGGLPTRTDLQIVSKLALLPNDRLKRQILDLISTLTEIQVRPSPKAKRRQVRGA